MPRLRALFKEFERLPSVRSSLAASIGWKAPSSSAGGDRKIDLMELLDAVPGGTAEALTMDLVAAIL